MERFSVSFMSLREQQSAGSPSVASAPLELSALPDEFQHLNECFSIVQNYQQSSTGARLSNLSYQSLKNFLS